jgi:hypothetical protein
MNIDEEKLKESCKNMVEELFATFKKRERYFKTKKFQKDFLKLKRFLIDKENHFIDDEDMLYLPKEYPFSSDLFYRVFEAIHSSKSIKKWEDKKNPFENEHFEYKGVQFKIMHGQGTSYTAWIE